MKTRWLLCAALVGAVAMGTLRAARAVEESPAPQPDATLRISAKALAAGAGFSWGSGLLNYKGKEYPVKLDGLTVGTVGITSIDAVGEVYDLKDVADISGTYMAAVAGSTIGGGGGKLVMKNQNGVVVHLQAVTLGVSLTMGVSGVKLALAK